MIRELKTYQFRRKKQLSLEDFEKIAKKISKFAVSVEFSGGEPLMNKEIFSMFNICKKYRIISTLASNSSLLTVNDNYKKLLDNPPDYILYSFEADAPDEYAKTRKKANYNNFLEGLKLFFQEREKRHMTIPIVTLQSVVTKRNYRNIKQHIELCRELGADFAAFKSLGVWPDGSQAYEDYVVSELLPDFSKCKIMRYYMDDGKIDWDRMGKNCPGYGHHMFIRSGGEV